MCPAFIPVFFKDPLTVVSGKIKKNTGYCNAFLPAKLAQECRFVFPGSAGPCRPFHNLNEQSKTVL
jgi:hypothetical protein